MTEKNKRTADNDTAVLMLSHVVNRGVLTHFKNMERSCDNKLDVYFLADNTRGRFNKYNHHPGFHLFTLDQLEALAYPGKIDIGYSEKPKKRRRKYHRNRNFVMGNTELPLLHFYKNNPDYKFYWVVEYDVYFSGSWFAFFSYFNESSSDLLATSLIEYNDVKNWFRWKSLSFNNKKIDEKYFLRGFFPIYRISKKALDTLDEEYQAGVAGHYECLVPTLLNSSGFVLEDIGGNGHYVKKENKNRFYTNTPLNDSHAPGTFVFRPEMNRPGKKSNTLWHPVKYKPLWRVVLSKIKRFIFSRN